MSPPYGTPVASTWGTTAPTSDRREIADGPAAAVTDRGLTHWRNEDAVGLRWLPGAPGRDSGFVMVVCDGVSLSQEPQLVSQAAVDTALLVLSGAVSAGGDLDAAMIEATAAAQRAASATPYDPTHELGPGACTFVAVAVRGRRATFASVGDSRAYWVEASGAYQVGHDDSLAAELVATGGYTHQQAMATSGAHALTKWLGVDSIDARPTLTSVELPGPGLVVLASDGLWNYAPELTDLARLIGPVGAEAALDLARRLAALRGGVRRPRQHHGGCGPPRPRPRRSALMDFALEVFQNEFVARGTTAMDAILTVDRRGRERPRAGRDGGRGADHRHVGLDGDAPEPHHGGPPGRGRGHRHASATASCSRWWPAPTGRTRSSRPGAPGLAVADPTTRAAAKEALRALKAGGGTAMSTWLMAARELFASSPTTMRHAILLTDGDNWEDPWLLDEALRMCRGQFQVDCRGVGTDWVVDELRTIATALMGTVDIIPEPEQMAAEFRR